MQWLQRLQAQVAGYLRYFNIKTLIEVQLMSVGALSLESLEVLPMLRNHVRLGGEDSLRLQVENESSEMSGCDEVLHLVVALHSILIGQELVKSIIHTAERHVTTEFGNPDGIVCARCGHQSLPLELNSHSCDVFNEPLYQVV